MKSTRKLLMATMLLILSLTAVVASTFAWFSIQTNPQIETVEIQVTSGQALRISLDADGSGVGTYKTNWTPEEFWTAVLGAGSTDKGALVLDTVTPKVVGTTFTPGSFNKIEYVLADSGGYNYDHYVFAEADSTATAAEEAMYIEFDIWFEADAALDVKLSAASVLPATPLDPVDTLGANITRLGFNVDSGNFWIYDPNPGVGYGLGQAANQFFNGSFILGNFPEMRPSAQVSGDSNYPTNIVVLESEGTDWKLPADNYTASASHNYDFVNNVLFQIAAGEAGRKKVTVYIWLEGWDGEATDAAKGAVLDVFLRFVGNPTVTP